MNMDLPHFTGIHDKNGTPICAGSILVNDSYPGRAGIIEYNPGVCGFQVKGDLSGPLSAFNLHGINFYVKR